jgi:MFS family permease
MGSLRTSVAALGRVLRNPDMRRALVAWMSGWAAEWAWLVALFVYAFGAGGLAVVGLVGLARTLPAAILAPVLGSLTDRFPRHRVLLGVHAGRAVLIGLATVAVVGEWSPLVVYAIGSLDALLAVLHRPTHMSMLPALARSPDELVGANVASSTVEAVGILAGPAIGGALVATGQVPLTFAAPALLFVVGAIAVAGLRPAQRLRAGAKGGIADSLLGGLRALRDHPHAALLLGIFATQTLVRGVLSVLIVAGAIQLLGMGEQGVGYLNAAIGAGGFVGALSSMALMGRTRLAPTIFLGLVLWGAPILVTGVAPAVWVALAAMAVLGAGNAVLDVGGFTLLQRSVPNAVRGRVFGVLEALVMLSVGVGAAVGPLLVLWLGVQGAWIATGAVLPLLAVVAWRGIAAADRHAVIPERELTLLRGVPMLQVLPLTVLEQVAADLHPMHFAAGEVVISQGAVGDRFYVIGSGEVEVDVSDQVVRRLGPGESFGEVALLRDVPRTADVVAVTDLELYAVGREAFVCAVTGDRQSMRAAEQVISERVQPGTR